ncbi:NAD-dependent epimerase/dehydratase family protein [Candidatus Peribacteria bacterium]|nr:NAD-dependent epimerase/dehydratase family protein [Candidatus Peribacteria bacterium]
MAKKIFITGGVGFIGVNAADHFASRGWQVTVFDNFSRRGVDINASFLKEKWPDAVTIIRGDVCKDQKALEHGAATHDVILHLAGQVAVTTSVKEPMMDCEQNLLGTLHVLEAARSVKNPPIVLFASTNKVYGGLESIPVREEEKRYVFADGRKGATEEEPLDFHSPYGCSKGAAEQYVRDYARIYGVPTVVFRQSCIYGPHQLGVEDQGWVAWFLIASMLKKPLQIYGNGKQVRDMLYVEDLVDLYIRAVNGIEKSSGQIYNIGGGNHNSISLLELLEHMEKKLGLPSSWTFAPVRPGDQPIFISDNSKAKADLGWEPKMDLEHGLEELCGWLKNHIAMIAKMYGVQLQKPVATGQ